MITSSELKEYLDRVLEIEEKILSIEEQIQYCRYIASGKSLSFVPYPGSGRTEGGSSQEYWIEKASKWEAKLYQLEYEKLDILSFVTRVSNRLQHQREALYITYRYISLMKHREIEAKEKLSGVQFRRILNKGLEHMADIINQDLDLERIYQKVMDSKSA